MPKRDREREKRGIQFDKRVERPQAVLERAISRPSPSQKTSLVGLGEWCKEEIGW